MSKSYRQNTHNWVNGVSSISFGGIKSMYHKDVSYWIWAQQPMRGCCTVQRILSQGEPIPKITPVSQYNASRWKVELHQTPLYNTMIHKLKIDHKEMVHEYLNVG